MYSTLLTIHSYWAVIALLALLVAILNAFMGMGGSKEFTSKDRKISLFGMVFTHIQLIIGLLLLFTSPYWDLLTGGDMGTVMKDSQLRLVAVEHPTTNILAIILITIGWSRHKKQTSDGGKFKSIGIFYVIGLVLLLSRIPWANWF